MNDILEEEVLKAFKRKWKDGIPAEFLNEIGEVMFKLFMRLFNVRQNNEEDLKYEIIPYIGPISKGRA